MPGLSQLKQFEKDILTLGDEPSLRASRGEKPVIVPIPKGITVDNDSDDFVLGMPEKPLEQKETVVDEDLSDISGTGKTSSSSKEQASSNAPDLSSLLSPVEFSDNPASDDSGMPDLSMFMDEPVQEEKIIETPQEPVEISVADMGLDALLAGAGFDGSEGALGDKKEEKQDFFSFDDGNITEIDPNDFFNDSGSKNISGKSEKLPEIEDIPASSLPELDFLYNPQKKEPEKSADDLNSFQNEDFSFDNSVISDDNSNNGDALSLDSLGFGDSDFTSSDSNNGFDLPDFDENFGESDKIDSSADFGGLEDVGDLSFETDAKSFGDSDKSDGFVDISDIDSLDIPSTSGNKADDGFNLDGLDGIDFIDETDKGSSSDNYSDVPAGLFDSSDLDFTPGESSSGFEITDDFSEVDLDSISETGTEDGNQSLGSDDFSFDFKDSDSGSLDFLDTVDSDIPDYDDDFGNSQENGDEDSVEVFDTLGMEDIDFGIPDTDSSLDDGSDFESAESDDFSFDADFEIPGFSDVETVKEQKSGSVIKNKNLDIPDFSKGIPGAELPANTLSDEQYKIFLKNFAEYPLNVRLAFEDLIVQNEFTDDAEFEVIEKVLNKAPARQVASMLEKMLDTSIPVPRDYEHRTAEEYEAYKKSIQYQLKNKILPAFFIGVLVVLVSWGMFNFTKNCIYIPAKATKYYKQGYTLLQADEYTQAQMKFDQAASYKMKKKWFFTFARGYREHKQYYRAADIYQKILYYFGHDKQAGLEYGDMELNDLSNYSSAEEIVRRQLLDYHVNDEDGILLLGDIFLEWGTEKDPSKLEDAKEQYLKLMQLYKPSNVYNARMMRYYIRSDNLQQVLNYKKIFEQNEKSLGSEDWTELGGYLLEKMYGPLSPSDEALRYKIEGLRAILQRAVTMDPENPTALYNLANYYINTNEIRYVESTLKKALDKFNKAKQLNKRELYRYIDSYRLLGENYIKTNDYLQAQEQYTAGITLYTTEKEIADFEGNQKIGKLYCDLADINYLLAGDYENATVNYKNSVELGYDNASIRYRLGYMSYKKKNYQEALGSFMKAGEGNVKEKNLLFSMGNALILRNDDYAAEGYYEQLLNELDKEVEKAGGSLYPQSNNDQYDLVNLYMHASNNYGVILHKIAKRTGDSQKNAQSIVQFQQSVRAWDSLTRNQTTMIRLEGSNLAEENIKYVTHPVPDFEPSIYLDIPKTLTDMEKL